MSTDAMVERPMKLSEEDKVFIKYLQDNCKKIEFFQIVRHLYKIIKKLGEDPIKCILIHPPLFSVHAESEQVISMYKVGHAQFELECNLFAIYGSFGCLSEPFTKRIKNYENDGSLEPRMFIDIFQSYIHHQYFESTLANKTLIKCIEYGHLPQYKDILFSLFGIQNELDEFDDDRSSWFGYRAILMRKTRNIQGLQMILQQFFADRGIDFDFDMEDSYSICQNESDDDMQPLGGRKSRLGVNLYSGSIFQNTQSCLKFCFNLETLDQYKEFVYSDLIHVFVKLALAYCRVSFNCIFWFRDINLQPQDIEIVSQDGFGKHLGVDSFVFDDDSIFAAADNNQELEPDADNDEQGGNESSNNIDEIEGIPSLKEAQNKGVLREHEFLYQTAFSYKKDEINDEEILSKGLVDSPTYVSDASLVGEHEGGMIYDAEVGRQKEEYSDMRNLGNHIDLSSGSEGKEKKEEKEKKEKKEESVALSATTQSVAITDKNVEEAQFSATMQQSAITESQIAIADSEIRDSIKNG